MSRTQTRELLKGIVRGGPPATLRALRAWEDSEAEYAASSAQARAEHDREVNAATAERASQYMAEQRSLDAARESYLYPCRGNR